jgi:hypothetical protein
MIKSSVSVLSALAAAALAGAALAAGPTLSVSATTSALSTAASTIIRFQDTGQDPIASIDVYAPPGYEAGLDQPIGATIGSLDGHVSTTATADVKVSGLVKNADPLAFVATAAACTPDRVAHDAVWTANLNSSGALVGRLALFVDRAALGDAADYSVRVRACVDDPATSGYRLVRSTITLNGVFENPAATGEYRWTTILRTHSQLPSVPVQSQTIVGLPPKLSLARKLIRPHGRRGRTFIRLSGNVTTNGRGVSGVRVEVLAGPRASALTRLTYATSFERGKYAVVAPLGGNRLFRARISAPLRAGPLSRCDIFKLQPEAICSSLTLAPFTAQSRSVTVTLRRP